MEYIQARRDAFYCASNFGWGDVSRQDRPDSRRQRLGDSARGILHEENDRDAGGIPAAHIAEGFESSLAPRVHSDDHNAGLTPAFLSRGRIGSTLDQQKPRMITEEIRDFGVQIRRRSFNQNVNHAATELLAFSRTATVRILLGSARKNCNRTTRSELACSASSRSSSALKNRPSAPTRISPGKSDARLAAPSGTSSRIISPSCSLPATVAGIGRSVTPRG